MKPWGENTPTPKGSPRVGPPAFSVSVTKKKSATHNDIQNPPISPLFSKRPSTTVSTTSKSSQDLNQTSKSQMSSLLQVGSYGSTRPNVKFVQRMTTKRRPATVGKVSCFFRQQQTSKRKTNQKMIYSPPAMMRSPEQVEEQVKEGEEVGEEGEEEGEKEATKRTRIRRLQPLRGQRLQTGLPPGQYRHPLSAHKDLRPLMKQNLTGPRESLVSNILRNARNGQSKPVLVASYDLKSGSSTSKRSCGTYVQHQNVVERFHMSPDARRGRSLKLEFAKPLNSLKRYRPDARMTDDVPNRISERRVPMHLRDRQRRLGRSGSRLMTTSFGRSNRRNRGMHMRMHDKNSLMVDNRGSFKNQNLGR